MERSLGPRTLGETSNQVSLVASKRPPGASFTSSHLLVPSSTLLFLFFPFQYEVHYSPCPPAYIDHARLVRSKTPTPPPAGSWVACGGTG